MNPFALTCTMALGALTLLTSIAHASNFGRHFPSEKRTVVDKITGRTLVVVTTDPAPRVFNNNTKPIIDANLRLVQGWSSSFPFRLHPTCFP